MLCVNENAKANIFNFVSGSWVDGPGIRSTIFIKGCPLKCLWCCNPEGQKAHIELRVIRQMCTGCGNCVEVCPEGAIEIVNGEKGSIQVDRDRCSRCMKCVDVCYDKALEAFGRVMTAKEAFTELSKGAAYFKRSGGGVTIGGGECTTAAEFTYSLMKLCQQAGIHVAIDSCGYTVNDDALQILKEADMVLYDYKGADEEEHIRNTGGSNRRILDNLRLLGELGVPVIIRMPLIPGYNDSEENIRYALELFLSVKSIVRIDVMAYHEFGKTKHEQLGMEYPLHDITGAQERAEYVRDLFEAHGLTAQLGG